MHRVKHNLGISRLKIISLEDYKAWDDEVLSCFQYDFYHTCSYHKLAKENNEGEPVLLTWDGGNLKIVLPLLIRNIDGTKYKDVTSVYGYAGPIFSHRDIPQNIILHFQNELKNYFISENIVSVFSRLHPLIDQKKIIFGLGDVVEGGKTVTINLKLPLEEQRKQYRKGTKYDVNKLKKENFEVYQDIDLKYLDEFIKIYHENMRRVNAKDQYFFNKNYMGKFFSSKNFEPKLFFVKDTKTKKNICGGIFVFTKNIIQYHLSGTYDEYLKIGPTKLLLDNIRILGTKQNYDIFHLGGGFGGSESDSLFNFKAGFSKERHSFLVWKFIVNLSAYHNLCSNTGIKEDNGFFPLYRLP